MPCVVLEKGGKRVVGGRLKREGIDVYTQTIDFVVEQKLTQHCKAIILQLKEKKKSLFSGG